MQSVHCSMTRSHSRSLFLLFGLVAILVNVLVDVRQSSDDACAQSAPVNVHVRTVVPSTFIHAHWRTAGTGYKKASIR